MAQPIKSYIFKLTKEQEELLNQGTKIYVNKNEYYYLPMWFCKHPEGIFTIYHLDKQLPKELVVAINSLKNPQNDRENNKQDT